MPLFYCKFTIFRNNFIFTTTLKDKTSRLEPDWPTSVNGWVISPFREGFISRKLLLAKISEFKIVYIKGAISRKMYKI